LSLFTFKTRFLVKKVPKNKFYFFKNKSIISDENRNKNNTKAELKGDLKKIIVLKKAKREQSYAQTLHPSVQLVHMSI